MDRRNWKSFVNITLLPPINNIQSCPKSEALLFVMLVFLLIVFNAAIVYGASPMKVGQSFFN